MPSATATIAEILEEKIKLRTARVGIIGLGYVGLPLAVEFAKAGFSVTGIDVQESKVSQLRRGESYIQDVSSDVLQPLVKAGKFHATTDFSAVRQLDTINIAVPTPLRKTKDPDMSFIVSACQETAKYFGPGKLVILESTTYPGTTDELVLPMLQGPGLKVGEHFFLCFSPERVDPGNPNYQTANIPKVVGGITPACTRLGASLYSQALQKVVPVSSTSVAEMVKLLENTFRMINIGLVNEMALMCDRMGINVWEVIDAAATKPFGFMPFYPGPGLGGHCIPIDPSICPGKPSKPASRRASSISPATSTARCRTSWWTKFKTRSTITPSLSKAPTFMFWAWPTNATSTMCANRRRSTSSCCWNAAAPASPTAILSSRPSNSNPRAALQDAIETSAAADCVVIVTDHAAFDYATIAKQASLIVDTRNALKNHPSEKVVRL